jgi:hypothetical protein
LFNSNDTSINTPTAQVARRRGFTGLRFRRFFKRRHGKRGIDTIIASLLMVIIVVIASVMVYTYATGLLSGLLVGPKIATENISLEYSSFTNATSVNLSWRNTGTTPISLTAYYVKDTSGDQYALTNWSIGTVNPTGLTTSTVKIGACAGCTLTGTSYTFQSGNAYTITLITARNNQFAFTVTRP